MEDVVIGKFRKSRWRHLRSGRSRVAQATHDCQACSSPISPGDEYFSEVRVWESRDYRKGMKSNHLEVRKYHVECPPNDERKAWERDFESRIRADH